MQNIKIQNNKQNHIVILANIVYNNFVYIHDAVYMELPEKQADTG